MAVHIMAHYQITSELGGSSEQEITKKRFDPIYDSMITRALKANELNDHI
jgi:hypothetical protein